VLTGQTPGKDFFMGFFEEFKAFAMRGNVVDMAVGIIIGSAFGKIATSLVNDVVMPPLGLLLGGMSFKDLKYVLSVTVDEQGNIVDSLTINYGQFIQTALDFFILALVIFTMIKLMNHLRHDDDETETDEPEQEPISPREEMLLAEIRDLLKDANKTAELKAKMNISPSVTKKE